MWKLEGGTQRPRSPLRRLQGTGRELRFWEGTCPSQEKGWKQASWLPTQQQPRVTFHLGFSGSCPSQSSQSCSSGRQNLRLQSDSSSSTQVTFRGPAPSCPAPSPSPALPPGVEGTGCPSFSGHFDILGFLWLVLDVDSLK